MKEAFDFAAFEVLCRTLSPPGPDPTSIPRVRKAINGTLIGSLPRPFIYPGADCNLWHRQMRVTINFYSFLLN
jgi:hypothetical protein